MLDIVRHKDLLAKVFKLLYNKESKIETIEQSFFAVAIKRVKA
jgi:hypothetical protein